MMLIHLDDMCIKVEDFPKAMFVWQRELYRTSQSGEIQKDMKQTLSRMVTLFSLFL